MATRKKPPPRPRRPEGRSAAASGREADAALLAALCAVEQAYDADDGARTLALGLPLLPRLDPHPALALRLRWVLTRALTRNGRGAEALALAEQALALCQADSHGAPNALATSLTWRGGARWGLGELALALDDLARAWALLPPDPDPALALAIANLLAVVHSGMGEHEAALQFATEALRFARLQVERPMIAAHYLGNLAGRHGEQALALHEAGQTEAARPHDQAQLALADEALALAATQGLAHPQAIFLQLRAAALARLGRDDEALAAFEQQRRLALEHGVQAALVYAARELAPLLSRRGDSTRAREVLEEATVLAKHLGIERHAADLYRQLSEHCAAAGEFEAALESHRRFHALHAATVLTAAQQRSQALSLRLRTEKARHEADRQALRAEALAHDNARLSRRASDLERAALVDTLTGLGNRRLLENRLPGVLARARADKSPLALVLLDLDHFKQINDRHSHQIGDAVLRRVAALLTEQARAGDLLVRWGGEELIWVLPGSDAEAARQACERLRLAVAEHDWTTLAAGLRVTLSQGLAALPATPDAGVEPDTLIARADAALYAAKAAGRNCVVLAAP